MNYMLKLCKKNIGGNTMKSYKIGDYARKLGVTSEYLKHYEQNDLIKANYSESGYRYFDFTQTPNVLSSLSLRNLGFSVKETRDILRDYDSQQIVCELNRKKEQILAQIKLSQANISQIDKIVTALSNNPPYNNWYIINNQPFYFIKHSLGYDLYDDDETIDTIANWIKYMPLVSSCCQHPFNTVTKAFEEERHWGLSIERDIAKSFNLEQDENLEFISGGRCLEYHSYEVRTYEGFYDTSTLRQIYLAPILKIIEDLKLEICGDMYEKVVFKHIRDDTHFAYVIHYVPIK